jgi:membrane protease YdiL (CAAX protease family)
MAPTIAALALPEHSLPTLLFAAALFALWFWALRPLARRAMRALVPEQRGPVVGWDAGHVGVVLVVVLAATMAIGFFGPHAEGDITITLVKNTAIFAAAAALAAVFAHVLDPAGVRALGFHASSNVRAIVAALCAWLLFLPCWYAVLIVWTWILEASGHGVPQQPIVEELAAVREGERLVPVVIGVLVQPFLEELLFRGFLQPVLVKRLRAEAGIVLTSALFACAHGLDAFVPLFALSILLGFVMWRTQRLLAAWAIHALNNGIQFAILYCAPDLLKQMGEGGLLRPF